MSAKPKEHGLSSPLSDGLENPPSVWPSVLLSDCAVVQTGVAKGRKLAERESITVPYLRVANVQDGYLDLNEIKTIEIKKSELPRFQLQHGDVLLTEGGDFDKLGRGFVWHGQIDPCVHQNHVFAVRVDRNQLTPEFFAYQAQSSYGKAYFLSVAHKTTNLACINTTKLKAFPVLIPPLPEQQKIAAVLGVVQRAMEQQERLLALTAELKKTLLHQLFTQGLRHEPQKPTDIGPVPESWEVLPLSDCAVVQTGAAKGRNFKGNETIEAPYLRVANVQSGYLNLTEMKTITIQAKELLRYALHDGDIVLTEGGDFDKLGRGFIWRGQIKDCVHQNHVFAVRVDRKRLLPEFFAHQSQSQYGKAYFLSVAHKTTNLACINTTKLKAFPVLIPSMEEQQEIVAALEGIDAKLSTVRRKHATLTALFRTLLHQLMTAQIRVAHSDLPSLS